MKKLFGTDGMRGVAGNFPLDAATVEIAGAALVKQLSESAANDGKPPRIVIGRDTRESGAWIEAAFAAGARAANAEVLSAGIITTPGVAYLTRTLSAAAGVVISASHNRYHDNGIKIFSPSGKKMSDATERQIEAEIVAASADGSLADENSAIEPFLITAADTRGDEAEAAALREKYLHYLATEAADDLSLAGYKIALDCANGAAFELAPALFSRLGAEVVAFNNTPDGRNINENCGSLHLEHLQARVTAERADIGVAFDGDADRVLFVDARGEIVDGDATLWVLAQDLAARGELAEDTVVATVMSNLGLELALKQKGWQLARTDVGDKYVLAELLRSGASIGGEQSGHVIFPRLSLAGDGMLTALMLLRAMRSANRALHELTDGFMRYPQTLVNVPVKEKIPFEEVAPVMTAAREIEDALAGEGRLLLRYSGTEPKARVMLEGKEQKTIDEYAARLAEVIKQHLG